MRSLCTQCWPIIRIGIVCGRTWDALLKTDDELRAEAHARAARALQAAAPEAPNTAANTAVPAASLPGSFKSALQQDEVRLLTFSCPTIPLTFCANCTVIPVQRLLDLFVRVSWWHCYSVF
jgi:hypothetical protein